MASWQFDFRLLPRIGVESYYRTIPVAITDRGVDETALWNNVPLTSNLRTQISQLLPRLDTWHADVERWGYEDGNRIDIVLEKESIVDVLVRVDAREISQVFLANLLQVARQNDWLVRTEDGRVFRPSLSRVLSAIHSSQAFGFVRDPVIFLEVLSRARDCEEERPPQN
jgi:hypothetical protein